MRIALLKFSAKPNKLQLILFRSTFAIVFIFIIRFKKEKKIKLCVWKEKKKNLLWRNRSDAHKLVIESHLKMIRSNMKSKRSKCKRSSLSSVWWAIEECVGLTGVIEIFTLVYFCCCRISIYVLTSKYIAMTKHNQRRIPVWVITQP